MFTLQKVMCDEFGHEFPIEFSTSDELNFIFLGLLINAAFIIYSL